MRNLDIADTRAKLEMYTTQGQLGDGQFRLIGELKAGGAQVIAAPIDPKISKGNEPLDRAALESGAD